LRQHTAAVVRIEYDAFRAKSWAERIELFNAISAEERAEIVRTHVSRWLSEHRHELTEEQIAIVEENIACIRPALYALPGGSRGATVARAARSHRAARGLQRA
jgi:hypothetical protein